MSVCGFCKNNNETSHHIFFTCPVTIQLWDWLSKGADQILDCSNCLNLLMNRIGAGSNLVQQLMNSAIIHMIWAIWTERNHRYFDNIHHAMPSLFNSVLAEVKLSYNLCL